MEKAGCLEIGWLECNRGCIGLEASKLQEFGFGIDGCIEFWAA